MRSTKKLRHHSSVHFEGPRRLKPSIRALNRAVRDRMAAEHDLVQELVRDIDVRQFFAGPRAVDEPYLVWHDFDHATTAMTEVDPAKLPKWRDIGQYLKMHLLFLGGLAYGGYSFTVRVRPDLEAKWLREGKGPLDRITRLVQQGLTKMRLNYLEYAFVVENRTKRGGITGLHLHGFLLTDDPLVATRFQVGMEWRLATHKKGRAAAGTPAKAGREVRIEPSYDKIDNSKRGRGRWVSYIAKNAVRRNKHLERSLLISRAGTQMARTVWQVMRGDELKG